MTSPDYTYSICKCIEKIHTHVLGGLIPLHNACSFGHAEVVRLLLRHGADPNSRDNWNYTPLHEAAVKGKVDVCVGEWFSLMTTGYVIKFPSLGKVPLDPWAYVHLITSTWILVCL